MIQFNSTLVVKIAKIGAYAARAEWVNSAAAEVGITLTNFEQEEKFSTITFSAQLDLASEGGLPNEQDLNEVVSGLFGHIVGELGPIDSWFFTAYPVVALPSIATGGPGPMPPANVVH